MSTTIATQNLSQMLRDESMSPQDRGDMLLYALNENGLDHRSAVQQLVTEADLGRSMDALLNNQSRRSLASERFLGPYHEPPLEPFAIVTNGPHIIYLPCTVEQLHELRAGDAVLIDTESRRIVGRDGATPIGGEIVTIESRPPEHPRHAVIHQRDQFELVRLHADLIGQSTICQPGDQVLYDSVRKIVLGPVTTESSGEELLVASSALESVSRAEVGSPHPIVDEILERYKAACENRDWWQALRIRSRCSYLLVGGTGTGKSYNLKLLTNEVHNLVELWTGVRSSRLVMLDAADFWAPYFGETEQRISRWAAKLQRLGSQVLTFRDGRTARLPLIVCLEEAEGLLRGRGETDGSGHLFDRAMSLFLQKTDSLECALQVPVIWITTSNRPDLADSAALRRLGMRRVTFDMLTPAAMQSVLRTKITPDMPIGPAGEVDDAARVACIQQILGYLIGPQPRQEMAQVTLMNGKQLSVLRQDMISPALLEEAVSAGLDAALRTSRQVGRLVGLDAAAVIQALHRHFGELVPTLRPHNIAEYCPRMFQKESLQVREVRSLLESTHRPLSQLLSLNFSPTGVAS
jgi:ATP-dependent 26S proteasome regulatory subunit